MIDFRYHLISLIAVFLALGLGILMGSVVLDEQLVQRLESRVDSFAKSNDELRRRVGELGDRLDAAQAFASEAQPLILGDRLQDKRVVIVEVDGTDGSTVDGISDAIETAGGEVAATVTVTNKLRLDGVAERDQLALILGSTVGTAKNLRVEMGTELGGRMAAASLSGTSEKRASVAATQRLEELAGALEDDGYLAIDRNLGETVPPDSIFAVVGGADGDAPFPVPDLALSLAGSLAERGMAVTVGEPSMSKWGVVTAIRDDADARTETSTIDQAETIAGRIAFALALAQADLGITGHYGFGERADRVIPESAPGD